MGDLEAFYRCAAELLAKQDADGFLRFQKVLADRMDDEGSPNAWILRLDWRSASKGPYPIYYVEVPEDAEGWLDEGRVKSLTRATQFTVNLCPAAKKLLGKGTMLNRQPFAGFPAFGLRYLGSHCVCSNFWRFSYGAGRAASMTKRAAEHVPWVERKKWAEDVYPGGYLNLFYPVGTLFRRGGWEWHPAGTVASMADLFAANAG